MWEADVSLEIINTRVNENKVEQIQRKNRSEILKVWRKRDDITLKIGSKVIKHQKVIKSSGVWVVSGMLFDHDMKKWSIKQTTKLSLIRLKPNTGGPKNYTRAIQCSVSESILLSGAPVSSVVLKIDNCIGLMTQCHRKWLTQITSTYRRV